ncbi:RNA binding protein, putative [Eimeria tenella]|uniref:RNA binding protein, putative n=1 Tax=Eimeria tenella TaxID=5802 RepID=U6KH97_EIMTE|nr:RNA binding protein, putative [Eimeria tenella]CDJ37375.1 RNA binding protein, putative [Eimeria tenella]|eukprot:XP_013228213.1 RNA binding protein, putative [Eimeria tenella]
MFVPLPYSRPDGAALPPAAALMPGAFPPVGGAPPGAPMGPVPLVLAPGFAPGGPPLLEREPIDVCKLFVGGLNPSTTEADLEEYFKQYGAVRSAVVMFDKKLNRSRCFGFVTFNTEKETLRAYCMGPHTIGGNEVELRRAIPRTTYYPGLRAPGLGPPRGGPPGAPGGPSPQRADEGGPPGGGPPAAAGGPPAAEDPDEKECKVFIGGIPPTMTTEDIHGFFSRRFGMVKRVDFFYDKVTGRMRGFGFLVFAFPHSAKMAVGHHQLGDVVVEVKKAVDKEEMRNQKEAEAASGGGSSTSSKPPPRRPPPSAQGGGVMVRSMRAAVPALDFVPLEMTLHPVAAAAAAAAAAGPPRGPLQDPYSVFPHAAVAAPAAAVAAAAPAAAAVAPSAYGAAYYPVGEPQQQLSYGGAPGGMFVSPGYSYVVAGGPQDIYGHQAAAAAAAEQQQITDPYDVQGAMRARAAKMTQRSQPY